MYSQYFSGPLYMWMLQKNKTNFFNLNLLNKIDLMKQNLKYYYALLNFWI